MKRILFLDHPQYTSCTFYLWHGLREIEETYPGKFEVFLYPYIPAHYDSPITKLNELPWFNRLSGMVDGWKRNPSSLPFGIPPFQSNETLTSMNRLELDRVQNPRLFHHRNILPDEDSVVRALEERKFDAIVLGNSHRVPTILLALLKARVSSMPPVIYLDAGERDELNEHWIHVFRPQVVFKQILTPEVKARGLTTQIPGYVLKIYPLPLSSPLVDQNVDYHRLPIQWVRAFSDCKRFSTKVFPVFYPFGMTWPERANVVAALDEWVLKGGYSVARAAATESYHLILAMSKMAVSMRGSGRDTDRYWIIPLYQTAMVCDGTMGCIHPYPFEDRKTAFFYRSIPELIDIVNRNQKDDREMLDVAIAGQAHLKKYHSTAARAVFFLDVLDRELNFYDSSLRSSISEFKSDRGWDGRPWEGLVV